MQPIKIWDINIDNIVISKVVKTKGNSKYLSGTTLDVGFWIC